MQTEANIRTYPAGYIEPSDQLKLARLNRKEENNADSVTSEVVRSWIENGRRIAKEEAERLKNKAKA
jgi:hypothetical protein